MSGCAGPSVVCIVLNWNGWRDTTACLHALQEVRYSPLTIMVADNGSTDESVVQIRRAFPNIELLENGANLGFGAGNNVAIRRALRAGASYVWLLNNDTLPAPDALSALVAKAEQNPRLGAIGSVLMYAHDTTQVQAWGGGRVNLWTGVGYHANSPVEDDWFDYLTGASILLRRQAIDEIGIFDENFFLYFEDADLGFRLRKGGWRLGVASGSIVLHKEHASTGRDRRVITRYAIPSGVYFLGKHASVPIISIVIFLVARVARRLFHGRIGEALDVFRAARGQPGASRAGSKGGEAR